MEFSMKRVNALFIKEVKDLKKNTSVLITCALPLVLSIIYSNFIKGEGIERASLYMCLNMNLAMVASIVMASLIAEEKEKNTLRTLMLSAISPMEFLAGKGIITLILSNVINVFIFFILGINTQYFVKYLIIGLILSISMIIIGAVIGIISKNQMATANVGTPVSMFFYLIPIFSSSNKTVKNIANFIPTYHSKQLITSMFKGESLLSGKSHLLVLLIWIVIASLGFAYIYKIKRLDD